MLAMRISGNRAALEQYVGDGRRYAVEELGPHLWIVAQDLYGALLDLRPGPCPGLAFLLRQLLTGRGLVMLNDFLGDLLHDWVRLLRLGEAHGQQHGHQSQQVQASDHHCPLSLAASTAPVSPRARPLASAVPCTHHALQGADTPARTRQMNASNSSSE